MINPERLCYAISAGGEPCRGIAVRGQLQCFAHGLRGRRLRSAAIERDRRPLARRRPLTVPELAAIVRRMGVARYFGPIVAAASLDRKR